MSEVHEDLCKLLPDGWATKDASVDGGLLINPKGTIFLLMETIVGSGRGSDRAVKAYMILSRIFEIAAQNGFSKTVEDMLCDEENDTWDDVFEFINELHSYVGDAAVVNAFRSAQAA